jgi:hypothetical protein
MNTNILKYTAIIVAILLAIVGWQVTTSNISLLNKILVSLPVFGLSAIAGFAALYFFLWTNGE